MSIPEKVIEKGLKTFDDVNYSRSEEAADKAAMHLVDMKSDNPLAKMIRPLLALIVTSVWVIKELAKLFTEKEIDNSLATNALMAVLGFYFIVRGAEKVLSRREAAKIQHSKLLTRQEIRERKREMRK
jgi:hypothetical protein